MSRQSSLQEFAATCTDPMVVAYRHDAHKLLGRRHENAHETVQGVTANEEVPLGADADAAALSRPPGPPEPRVNAHQKPYRLSLISGSSLATQALQDDGVSDTTLDRLLAAEDPQQLHSVWLQSKVPARFNEAMSYPYTSLKYHTLLVGALLANYRADTSFATLNLVVDKPPTVVPYRTVYAGDRFALRLDAATDGAAWAPVGAPPRQHWAATWSQLTDSPLPVDTERAAMVLDANLRRIHSWSTALQYLEDAANWLLATDQQLEGIR